MPDKPEPRLFLVSTPLHLLVSIAIVAKEKLDNCHLIFIDQVQGNKNIYLETLSTWKANPFRSMDVFYRPAKKPLKKLKHRRETFSRLERVVNTIKPKHIYVGNDRRIEFQWCMHKAVEQGYAPKGYYLDEGTFTYVGRQASFSFSDRVVDNTIKKITYGCWWQHPPTVGASAWIDTVYASFPELVFSLLKRKQVRHLSLEYWQASELTDFCSRLIDNVQQGLSLNKIDTVITLPHESVIASNQGYAEKIGAFVERLLAEDKIIAVKYHPRDTHNDALHLQEKGAVMLLPAAIPFEALLPMLKPRCEVLGDFSTTLISSRILRPDVIVKAIDHDGAINREQFLQLYHQIGIELF